MSFNDTRVEAKFYFAQDTLAFQAQYNDVLARQQFLAGHYVGRSAPLLFLGAYA